MNNARGFACIGLHQPKNSTNIGEALRASSCYDVSLMAITGRRFKKAATDVNKAYRHLPLIQTDSLESVIPYDAVPVAVEFIPTALPLHTYVHPERAFYIFGPEDGSVPTELVKKCRDVVYVPTEFCMNLAATVNVLLYDRRAKQLLKEGR